MELDWIWNLRQLLTTRLFHWNFPNEWFHGGKRIDGTRQRRKKWSWQKIWTENEKLLTDERRRMGVIFVHEFDYYAGVNTQSSLPSIAWLLSIPFPVTFSERVKEKNRRTKNFATSLPSHPISFNWISFSLEIQMKNLFIFHRQRKKFCLVALSSFHLYAQLRGVHPLLTLSSTWT